MELTRYFTRASLFIVLFSLTCLSASQAFTCSLIGEWTRTAKEEERLGGASEDLIKQWKEFYTIIREEEKLVQNIFRDATNAQFKAASQLRSAELKKDQMQPAQLASLQHEYEKSVEQLKKAKLQQKEIKKLIEKARKINANPGGLTEKKVISMRTDYNAYLAKFNPGQQPVINPEASPPAPSKPTAPSPVTDKPKPVNNKPKHIAAQQTATGYDPEMVNKRPGQAKATAYFSQPFACIYEKDTIDQASGMQIKSLVPGLLFTYTDPDLRPYFRDKELMTCVARLSKTGPYTYLTIEFQIASTHSQSNFGSLQEGSALTFKLMNDEFISLYNLKTNTGHIDPYTGYTIFSGQYALGKQDLKKLGAAELDKMRVMWSTGYEDYDVYHVDFLIDQINCLMSK